MIVAQYCLNKHFNKHDDDLTQHIKLLFLEAIKTFYYLTIQVKLNLLKCINSTFLNHKDTVSPPLPNVIHRVVIGMSS